MSLDEVVTTCSGFNISPGEDLFDYWQTHNCPVAYSQFINTAPDGSLTYNVIQQATLQDYVNNLFETYFITNTLTDDVTSPEFNNFQNTLLSLCIDPTLPGVCGQFLFPYCSEITRTDAINSPTLTNFCGCYVPPDPTYLKLTVPPGCTGTGCTGNAACDPLCHRALTSHQAIDATGELLECPQTICVIDDVVINANQSQVPGGINFNTVCMGCNDGSSDGCLCIVAGVDISATMANIGVGANFNQFCGTGSVCLVEDGEGNIISEGGCESIQFGQIPAIAPPVTPFWGLVILIVVIVIIVLVLVIVARNSRETLQYPTVFTESGPPPSPTTPQLVKQIL
jgi:hypothetical protein